MGRLARLVVFGVVAVVAVVALVWTFRGQLLRIAGVSLDTGGAGETQLQVAPGLVANVFASGLSSPRFMAIAPDGTLLVAERGPDRVVALPDRDGDGRADAVERVGIGYDGAHSLAVAQDGSLLIAGSGAVFRVELGADGREASRDRILELPPGGQHSTRTIVLRPDGSLLVSVGSSCDVCEETGERRATVLAAAPDGSGARVLMRGLRNAVGMAIDPATGEAWATTHGRDRMGDDVPPETLYRLVDGADAGWPRCHAGTIVDPDFGTRPDPRSGRTGCDGVAIPAATFQAHAAPLGLAFWRDHAVIAFHGSWNRSSKVGYEVVWLPWSDGPAGPAETLVTGFLDPSTGDSTGRPAGLTVGADGALYISDDKAGFIYRVALSDSRSARRSSGRNHGLPSAAL